ncbi:glucosylceramidase-like [Copidosoma floridanum]|uniref:glucosylceramidase-like n=1 Tax=Copidosoma floridanum TaxID=29053 RepID=UPI000C6FB022|nr:glucosylceramidase-like [Copidosoma floridanum]
MLRYITIIFISSHVSVYSQSCEPINFGGESIVCKCNSTYCDFYSDPKPITTGEFIWYVTSKSGLRLNRFMGKIANKCENNHVIKINSNIRYQSMKGFGGAITDAAGINIKKLSEKSQDNLMRSYFGKDGSKYNIGRIPIAGTDFSTRAYTYDDTSGDKELKYFKLVDEDFLYKMPLMKRAKELNPSIRFLATPWTAPPWMKSNKKYNGLGWLLDEYYQTYANYIIKFLEEYQKHGFNMWAVSTGNEPLAVLNPLSHINTMLWTPCSLSAWVVEYLGPSLQKSISNSTSILIIDDQRLTLPIYAGVMAIFYRNTLQYVKGLAVHWYLDEFIPPFTLDITHMMIPDKFIISTEFSVGNRPWEMIKVDLGSWSRAERLILKLIQNINHWVSGWIDWNLALDIKGGPNWVGNNIDALIIVDPENDTFYKQPMYYAMTHFSKFVSLSSIRIEAKSNFNTIAFTAFLTSDNYVVLILYNSNANQQNVSIVDDKVGSINIALTAYSLQTILYKNR